MMFLFDVDVPRRSISIFVKSRWSLEPRNTPTHSNRPWDVFARVLEFYMGLLRFGQRLMRVIVVQAVVTVSNHFLERVNRHLDAVLALFITLNITFGKTRWL